MYIAALASSGSPSAKMADLLRQGEGETLIGSGRAAGVGDARLLDPSTIWCSLTSPFSTSDADVQHASGLEIVLQPSRMRAMYVSSAST